MIIFLTQIDKFEKTVQAYTDEMLILLKVPVESRVFFFKV